MDISLYIHFPFCLKKCLYCDFDSVAGAAVEPADYVAAVLKEMELRAAMLPVKVAAPTLYLGGGTPSLMSPELVGRLVDSAAKLYGLQTDAEVTLEANPGTLSAVKLRGFRQAGVNRLSLGVQSLDDRLLQRLGRIHTTSDAVKAFTLARTAQFENIGMDLIHSLPGQSLGMWLSTLKAAVEMAPEHISAYALSVEEGTPFAAMDAAGRLALPEEEDAIAMFESTIDVLGSSGYGHYEISNFAREGHRSRHNQVYWRRGNYLGFGAGAHSFLREPAWGVRWVNPRSHTFYLSLISEGTVKEEELQHLNLREALGEAYFLGLRLLEGIDLLEVEAAFGPAVHQVFAEEIAHLLAEGLLVKKANRLCLSPQAVIVANQVFSRFI